MATVIESGIGTINYGRQSAKGTIATAATTTVGYDQPKWSGGHLSPNKKLGNAEFIDGSRFGSPSTYTDSVGGEVGSLSLQLQPENAGLYCAAILGVDTVTGASDPYTHTITSAGTSGHWATWWQKVGSAVGPERQYFMDSKIAKLALSSTFADKVLTADLDIQSLTAATTYATDAAKTQNSSDPYFHTEATGSFSVDSLVINEVTEAMLEVDTMMTPFYGDSIAPLQLIEGKGMITNSVKSIVTDDTLGKFRKAVYNAAAPTSGTAVNKAVFYAAMTQTYTRSATKTLTVTCPRVAIDPATMNVAPKPEGGEIELTLGGTALKDGSTAALTIVALSADATTYA
jgi:hypothetical protein